MLPLDLNDLTPADVQELIDSEVAESLTLDYKEKLPSTQREEKREFLCDVAAMANAAGGDLIYGLVDRRDGPNQSTGIPEKLSGMKVSNAQFEIGCLSNSIRDSTEPRLIGVSIQVVACRDGDVLVIRVPRSWNKPHMVTFGGLNKFFGRVPTGKYPMGVEEIGRVFTEQNELGETISGWRTQRATLVLTDLGPVRLSGPVTLLFHVIPSSAFAPNVLRESWAVSQQERLKTYVPHAGTSERYNSEGFLRFASSGGINAYGYTQLFRSGIAEYANSLIVGVPAPNSGNMIFGQSLEQEMVQCYEDAANRLRRYGRSEPVYVGFSLLGISGQRLFSTMTRIRYVVDGRKSSEHRCSRPVHLS